MLPRRISKPGLLPESEAVENAAPPGGHKGGRRMIITFQPKSGHPPNRSGPSFVNFYLPYFQVLELL